MNLFVSALDSLLTEVIVDEGSSRYARMRETCSLVREHASDPEIHRIAEKIVAAIELCVQESSKLKTLSCQREKAYQKFQEATSTRSASIMERHFNSGDVS